MAALLLVVQPPVLLADECVVLLHGLARTANSMRTMQYHLESANYRVANIDYPSRKHPVAELAPMAVEAGLRECGADASPVHFVTHSLGGILVRYYFAQHEHARLGRVVMLAPPNQGSEVVDNLRDVPGFRWFNGPAGQELGTDVGSVPLGLGAVTFDLGVIAGTRTFNPLLSQFLPNPDDGKVSVASTRVDGMADFTTVAVSHPFIMRDDEVIELTLHFLEHGVFGDR